MLFTIAYRYKVGNVGRPATGVRRTNETLRLCQAILLARTRFQCNSFVATSDVSRGDDVDDQRPNSHALFSFCLLCFVRPTGVDAPKR